MPRNRYQILRGIYARPSPREIIWTHGGKTYYGSCATCLYRTNIETGEPCSTMAGAAFWTGEPCSTMAGAAFWCADYRYEKFEAYLDRVQKMQEEKT